MNDPRITPSRWYYVLSAVIFVGGWVLFIVFLFKSLTGMEANLQQVVAPGETEITLRSPGNYTISYEYHSVVGGKIYSTDENISGLECVLVSKAKGSRITLSPSRMNSTYEFGGRSGRSIFDFTIDQPGGYTLTSAYPQDQVGPEVVLAVGKDSTAGLFLTIGGGLALVFGSMGIALAVTLITLIKRSNKKKRLASEAG